jgi:hypothetical protein
MIMHEKYRIITMLAGMRVEQMIIETRETRTLELIEKNLKNVTNDLKRENVNKLLQYYYFKKLKQN